MPTFSPSSYVSFVAVTTASGLDWYIAEGLYTATVTLTTTGIPTGTELYWTTLPVSGTLTTDDFTDGQIQGLVTIDSQGKGTITRNARADLFTEGSELFKLEIRETSYTSPVMITSTSSSGAGVIGIGDSSTSPAPTTYDSFVGATDLSAGSTTLFEGQYTATFTLTTSNGVGKTVYWTTLGSVTCGTMTTDDFTDGQLQGTVIIGSNGTATITRSARADLFTEGNEVFALEIRETSYTSPVKITSNSLGIADTSTTPTTPPLSYTSFVGVTNDSGLDWYISEVLGGTVTSALCFTD